MSYTVLGFGANIMMKMTVYLQFTLGSLKENQLNFLPYQYQNTHFTTNMSQMRKYVKKASLSAMVENFLTMLEKKNTICCKECPKKVSKA